MLYIVLYLVLAHIRGRFALGLDLNKGREKGKDGKAKQLLILKSQSSKIGNFECER